jgi:hypothetical protein
VTSNDEHWSLVEEFALLVIDPVRGSIARKVSPWWVWPRSGPSHMHVTCALLVVLDVLHAEALVFESGRLIVANDNAPQQGSLPDRILQAVLAQKGSLRKQLKAATLTKHPRVTCGLAPHWYNTANPWYTSLQDLECSGRLSLVTPAGMLRAPRVRFNDLNRRDRMLGELQEAASSSAQLDDVRVVALLAAIGATFYSWSLLGLDGATQAIHRRLDTAQVPEVTSKLVAAMHETATRRLGAG